jgi:hypothetical protein
MQMSAEIEKVQAQADIATQQTKTQAELALAERRFELERQMKLLEASLKTREHENTMAMRAAQQEQDARAAQAQASQQQQAPQDDHMTHIRKAFDHLSQRLTGMEQRQAEAHGLARQLIARREARAQQKQQAN